MRRKEDINNSEEVILRSCRKIGKVKKRKEESKETFSISFQVQSKTFTNIAQKGNAKRKTTKRGKEMLA